ncbi:hypothetical protein Ahy_B09g098651 isoform A [Arachis hypogaea]|uniref:Uncharacterized protein n=1 Tax=Arachis hypogaea TaxID=3818 RepID=A0A444XSG6_ARAHY|nr:hypothetical protein Ahy_B09g098651 isoform A [Arachis hypogaea]
MCESETLNPNFIHSVPWFAKSSHRGLPPSSPSLPCSPFSPLLSSHSQNHRRTIVLHLRNLAEENIAVATIACLTQPEENRQRQKRWRVAVFVEGLSSSPFRKIVGGKIVFVAVQSSSPLLVAMAAIPSTNSASLISFFLFFLYPLPAAGTGRGRGQIVEAGGGGRGACPRPHGDPLPSLNIPLFSKLCGVCTNPPYLNYSFASFTLLELTFHHFHLPILPLQNKNYRWPCVTAKKTSEEGDKRSLPSMSDILEASRAQKLDLQLKTLGPFFRITATSLQTRAELGKAEGLVRISFQGTKILHLDSMKLRRETLSMEKSIFGLGLFIGAVAILHGYDSGCTTAQLLAINDSDLYHSKLVRFYSRLGFREVCQVSGSSIGDIPHMLVWGGVGTRMDASIEELMLKWCTRFKKNQSPQS